MGDALQDSVEAVVRQALSLPGAEQRRVLTALEAVLGPVSGTHPPPSALAREEGEDGALAQWLAGISSLPAWEQLQLLDAALDEVEGAEETDAVLRARENLLDNHPALAVRLNVTQIFEAHPVLGVLGALGFVGGGVSLCRRLFQLSF